MGVGPGGGEFAMGHTRCFWVPDDVDEYVRYHDAEWGFPQGDDRRLFEKICLEGFQSGLSWLTILRKRENFRAAFAGFDFERVARFGERDVVRLLGDEGIVRHRGKIEAVINNARRACELRDEVGSLAGWFWQFEPDPSSRPSRIDEATLRAMTTSAEAKAMARELKLRGWRFVGPTTAYAFFQAMGLVNDHEERCATRTRVEAARAAFTIPDPGPR